MATAPLLNRAGWEIKCEDDLAHVLSQAEVIKRGRGAVLHLREVAGCQEAPVSADLPAAPEWDTIGAQGETAKLLYQSGLKSKAYRYGRCGRYAIPLTGHDLFCDLREKSFVRYRCGLRFCKACAPRNFRGLFDKYQRGFVQEVEKRKDLDGYVLARINFTISCDGHELKPDEIRAFNKAVRRLVRRLFPDLKMSKDEAQCGLAWCDEFGHPKSKRRRTRKAKGWNLHAHGLWFGPYIEWRRARDLWRDLTGSSGFWIKEVKCWKTDISKRVSHALTHMLKYVSKLPGETPARIAGLERAFDGVVRVHRMGFFYHLSKSAEDVRPGDTSWTCPHCGRALFPERPFTAWPVADLGPSMVDIEQADREMRKRLALGGGP